MRAFGSAIDHRRSTDGAVVELLDAVAKESATDRTIWLRIPRRTPVGARDRPGGRVERSDEAGARNVLDFGRRESVSFERRGVCVGVVARRLGRSSTAA